MSNNIKIQIHRAYDFILYSRSQRADLLSIISLRMEDKN